MWSLLMYPLNSVVHFSLNEMMNTLLFLTSILLSGERDSCLYWALGHQSRSQRSFSFSCCRYCSLSWPYTLLLESVKPAHRNPRSNEREEFTSWIGLPDVVYFGLGFDGLQRLLSPLVTPQRPLGRCLSWWRDRTGLSLRFPLSLSVEAQCR